MQQIQYTSMQRLVAYILLVSFFLQSCYNPAIEPPLSLGSLPALKARDLSLQEPVEREINDVPHAPSSSLTIVKKATSGEDVKLVYDEKSKAVRAYVTGQADKEKMVKPHDMPKELQGIKNHLHLRPLMDNAYLKTSKLDSGDVKLYVDQRGVGGVKGDRDKPEWNKLLTSIHDLWKSRNPNKAPIKAFISYAWEDLSTEAGKIANSKLQNSLKNLRDDLQKAGISVFLDVGDMHGDMKQRMEDNLKASDVIITINTPRFKARAETPTTNLAFEYNLTLEKAKTIPYGIFPLHYSGEFNDSFPGALMNYLVRDCRDMDSYTDRLVATQGPLGIIPAIYGIKCSDDKEYQSLIHGWKNQGIHKLPAMNSSFIARENLLINIENLLDNAASNMYQQPAISGIGGVGKSSLALAYAYKHSDKYKMKRWLNVAGENVSLEFEKLASELGIDSKGMDNGELASNVYKRISSIDTWLLVFDNAGDYKAIKDYLPNERNPGQHILITSRSQHFENRIMIDCFSEAEAVEYINKALPGSSQEQAKLLASTLGHLPLALGQVVSYIQKAGISLKSYIKLYQENGIALLNNEDHSLKEENYPHSILTTWSNSLEEVKAQFPEAARMLMVCTYLGLDNIPLALFANKGLLQDALTVNRANKILRNYSLVRPSKLEDHIHVHPLLAAVIKAKHKKIDNAAEREELALLQQVIEAYSSWLGQSKDQVAHRSIFEQALASLLLLEEWGFRKVQDAKKAALLQIEKQGKILVK